MLSAECVQNAVLRVEMYPLLRSVDFDSIVRGVRLNDPIFSCFTRMSIISLS